MKEKKTVTMRTLALSVIGTAILSGGLVVGYEQITQQGTSFIKAAAPESDELAKVHALYTLLQTDYYKKVDSSKLVDGALKGMTSALDDPYSTYLEKSDAAEFTQALSDSFEGIGATLSLVDNVPQIAQAPIKGTPAEKSGLKAGDQILAVDDTPTTGQTLNEIVSKIRGKKGTTVTLSLQRGQDPFKVTLTRDKIPLHSVTSELDEAHPTIGKIAITTFSEKTATELKEAIIALRSKGAKSFVIDLRQNPGGLLDQVSQMASMFLKDGQTIVQLESRNGAVEKTVAAKALDGGFKVTEPTAVLVDSGSASASEIFAGAVNESANVPLIGTKTFGKGTVQTVSQYQDGSEVKLTIKKWLTPKKEWIHEKGLQPTYAVDYPAFVTAPPLPTDQILQQGISSTAVKSLNLYLAGLGYQTSGEVFDETTKAAVLDFQLKHQLTPTGTVESQTAKQLTQAALQELKTNDQMYQKAVELLTK